MRWFSRLTELNRIKTSLSECKESGSVFHHLDFHSQIAQIVKNLLTMQETGFDSLGQGRPPWEGNKTPSVFLPGESKGQRSLAVLQSRTPSDMTEPLNTLTFTVFTPDKANGIKKSCTLVLVGCSKFLFPFLKSLSHSEDFLRLNRKGFAINCQSRLWT